MAVAGSIHVQGLVARLKGVAQQVQAPPESALGDAKRAVQRHRHQGCHCRNRHVEQALPQDDAHGKEDLRRGKPGHDHEAHEPEQPRVLREQAQQDAAQHEAVRRHRHQQQRVFPRDDVRDALEAVVEALLHGEEHLVEVHGVGVGVREHALRLVLGARDVVLEHRPRVQEMLAVQLNVSIDVCADDEGTNNDAHDAPRPKHFSYGRAPELQRPGEPSLLGLLLRLLRLRHLAGAPRAAEDSLVQYIEAQHSDAVLLGQGGEDGEEDGE
mmetsp:Transcript_46232/g.144590  ORF Transcript_46232/g.144590 Transcript_46232/m.144590 type:complete len:269 (+) Transcript_46232:1904-2710(+)